jgi:hypothetical protein
MVYTPVGVKCRECGLTRGGRLYTVSLPRLALAAVTSLAAGAIAAVMGELGFFVIFLGAMYGYFAGSVILKVSGMRRGRKLEFVTGVGMVVGALALKLLPTVLAGKPLAITMSRAISFGPGSLLDPFLWLSVVIATSCAVSKIRYL